jgi:hypothetical protein
MVLSKHFSTVVNMGGHRISSAQRFDRTHVCPNTYAMGCDNATVDELIRNYRRQIA